MIFHAWESIIKKETRASASNVKPALNSGAQKFRKAVIKTAKFSGKSGRAGGRWESTPSAAGKPPAVFTGALSQVDVFEKQSVGASFEEIRVGSSVMWARAQEFGNSGRNLPARPWMAPTVEREWMNIVLHIGNMFWAKSFK